MTWVALIAVDAFLSVAQAQSLKSSTQIMIMFIVVIVVVVDRQQNMNGKIRDNKLTAFDLFT